MQCRPHHHMQDVAAPWLESDAVTYLPDPSCDTVRLQVCLPFFLPWCAASIELLLWANDQPLICIKLCDRTGLLILSDTTVPTVYIGSRRMLAVIALDAHAGTAQQNVRTRFAGTPLRRSRSNGCRCWAGQWLENSAEQDVKLPIERCYEMWEDRERIPQWMPWIKSVKVS